MLSFYLSEMCIYSLEIFLFWIAIHFKTYSALSSCFVAMRYLGVSFKINTAAINTNIFGEHPITIIFFQLPVVKLSMYRQPISKPRNLPPDAQKFNNTRSFPRYFDGEVQATQVGVCAKVNPKAIPQKHLANSRKPQLFTNTNITAAIICMILPISTEGFLPKKSENFPLINAPIRAPTKNKDDIAYDYASVRFHSYFRIGVVNDTVIIWIVTEDALNSIIYIYQTDKNIGYDLSLTQAYLGVDDMVDYVGHLNNNGSQLDYNFYIISMGSPFSQINQISCFILKDYVEKKKVGCFVDKFGNQALCQIRVHQQWQWISKMSDYIDGWLSSQIKVEQLQCWNFLKMVKNIRFINLKVLTLSGNNIETIEYVCRIDMPKLQALLLHDNNINRVSSLRKSNFHQFRGIGIKNNVICDHETLTEMQAPNLQKIGLQLIRSNKLMWHNITEVVRYKSSKLKYLHIASQNRIYNYKMECKILDKFPKLQIQVN